MYLIHTCQNNDLICTILMGITSLLYLENMGNDNIKLLHIKIRYIKITILIFKKQDCQLKYFWSQLSLWLHYHRQTLSCFTFRPVIKLLKHDSLIIFCRAEKGMIFLTFTVIGQDGVGSSCEIIKNSLLSSITSPTPAICVNLKLFFTLIDESGQASCLNKS